MRSKNALTFSRPTIEKGEKSLTVKLRLYNSVFMYVFTQLNELTPFKFT